MEKKTLDQSISFQKVLLEQLANSKIVYARGRRQLHCISYEYCSNTYTFLLNFVFCSLCLYLIV